MTTTEPTVNVPLMRKVLEHIEAEAVKGLSAHSTRGGDWDQGSWITVRASAVTDESAVLDPTAASCGTTACFAGQAAIMSGAMVAPPMGWTSIAQSERRNMMVVTPSGDWEAPSDATNTASDLRRICEDIAGEKL